MRILLADSNHPVLHELLMAEGFVCDLFWDKSPAELQAILPQYDGMVIRSKFKVTAALLDQCPNLKCIGRVGAGMENIDMAHAMKNKVICVSAPEGNRDAVGEHAIGMLLMLLNNLRKADREVRKNIWLRAPNRGTELGDKIVGIIGYGHMGSSFAAKLRGFGCRVLAYDKYKSGFGNQYVTECSLEDIFLESDILSLHVPLTEETTYLVNRELIDSFRKPIYIINTARGKCLNTADLVQALQNGKVRGACLDVLEYESPSFENIESAGLPEPFQYLMTSENVVLSPHIAGWTHESNYKMSRIIAEKMRDVLRPKN